MWMILGLLVGILILAALIVPFLLPGLYRRIDRAEYEVRRLRERLDRLERTPPREPAAPPPLHVAPLEPAPAPLPPAAPLPPEPIADEAIESGILIATPAQRPLPPPSLREPRTWSATHADDAGTFEDLIGSVWFQNLGAVLILVGAFFLILWGYTTGRFGPGVLVGAGVAVGLVIAWRGDRLVKALPGFGHALIGVGFGIVYLSLFLGHFTLRVLPAWLAFSLLVLTSLATLLAGLRHRVQTIAALGVIGAFLPQYLAGLLGLQGFSMSPGGMLAYLAAVNAVVFALAARAGWSGLDFAALLLSAALWVFRFGDQPGTWPITIGLAALFTAFGFAPLPRLVQVEGRVKPADLAVIVVAPLAFVACAWPTLAYADRTQVAMLLGLLAAAQLAAALWVDARRPERDLWRPLTGSATLFLTAALQRAVGTAHTPMAWTIEGVLLIWLGLGRGGGWLRVCGSVVTLLGAVWLLVTQLIGYDAHAWWTSVRNLVCIAALLFLAQRLHARRGELAESERITPEFWLALSNLSLMLWMFGESRFLAQVLAGPGGIWDTRGNLEAPAGGVREAALQSAITGAAWLFQSFVLMFAGLRGRPFVRGMAHFVAIAAASAVLTALVGTDGWGRDVPPLVHAPGLLTLLTLAAGIVVTVRLARTAQATDSSEARPHHVWGSVIALLFMVWIRREADHVARALFDVAGPLAQSRVPPDPSDQRQVTMLGPVFTSVGWLAEALVALTAGWRSGSRFLRWLGLGLAGFTAVKFVLIDLASADPFWRFLTAIVLGTVLMLVSFAYQRRKRAKPHDALTNG